MQWASWRNVFDRSSASVGVDRERLNKFVVLRLPRIFPEVRFAAALADDA